MGQNSVPTVECGDPAITAADLAATPRENTLAEVLAILADNGPFATDASYERAVRDYDALVDLDARLSRFWWSGINNPRIGDRMSVGLSGSKPMFEEAARCVNDEWGATVGSKLEIGDSLFVPIELDGVFNLDLLAAAYTQLPGVIQADPEVPAPPPVITDDEAFVRGVVREGAVYTYSFGITKLACSIDLKIAVDGAGTAEIVSWKSVPEAAECQPPDGGI